MARTGACALRVLRNNPPCLPLTQALSAPLGPAPCKSGAKAGQMRVSVLHRAAAGRAKLAASPSRRWPEALVSSEVLRQQRQPDVAAQLMASSALETGAWPAPRCQPLTRGSGPAAVVGTQGLGSTRLECLPPSPNSFRGGCRRRQTRPPAQPQGEVHSQAARVRPPAPWELSLPPG